MAHLPPTRRYGSFHPRSLEPFLEDEDPGPAALQPHDSLPPFEPTPPTSPEAPPFFLSLRCNDSPVGCWILGVIALLSLLAAAISPLLFAVVIPPSRSIAAIIPPALSLVGSLAVICAWMCNPMVRSAHTGQVACLSVACVWFSAAWLIFFAGAFAGWTEDARCTAFKVALAGWVASFLWCWPISIDWILLMRGDHRSQGTARRTLSRMCHLTWFAAAGLALPLLRSYEAHLVPVTNTSALESAECARGEGADEPPVLCVCHLDQLRPSWWPYVLATSWCCTVAFTICAHALCSSEDTPRVVGYRHRRRALTLAVSFCTLQAPAALLFWNLWSGPGEGAPALLLGIWSIFAGVPWQGASVGIAFAWNEPTVRAALLRWCRRGGDFDEPHHFARADSRFVHFERVISEQEAHVHRALNLEESEGDPDAQFRFASVVLSIVIISVFFGLLLLLHL
jgi:hypothetical protein